MYTFVIKLSFFVLVALVANYGVRNWLIANPNHCVVKIILDFMAKKN